jgi:hypothetical protein
MGLSKRYKEEHSANGKLVKEFKSIEHAESIIAERSSFPGRKRSESNASNARAWLREQAKVDAEAYKAYKRADKLGAESIDKSAIKSSGKSLEKNFEPTRSRDLNINELSVVEFVHSKHPHPTHLKEIAVHFSGDYLKAKNAVRRPRWAGLIKMGPGRGEYSKP